MPRQRSPWEFSSRSSSSPSSSSPSSSPSSSSSSSLPPARAGSLSRRQLLGYGAAAGAAGLATTSLPGILRAQQAPAVLVGDRPQASLGLQIGDVLVGSPPPGQSNLAPSAGLQFFGQVDIDPASKDMVVALRDLDGNTLYAQRLSAERCAGFRDDD